jgi:hypothetical protein
MLLSLLSIQHLKERRKKITPTIDTHFNNATVHGFLFAWGNPSVRTEEIQAI